MRQHIERQAVNQRIDRRINRDFIRVRRGARGRVRFARVEYPRLNARHKLPRGVIDGIRVLELGKVDAAIRTAIVTGRCGPVEDGDH